MINKKKIEKQKLYTLNILLSNFNSYSQHFEDFILFYLFYDVEKGFYIDVGANDPNFISVTKAFYSRGWHGINIEPLPDKIYSLKKYRKRDINLQLAAGKEKNISTLIKKGPSGLCSSIIYDKVVNNSIILNITIEAMKNICLKYVPKGTTIDFCKIDVEGEEKNVLLGYDFENFRPKVFCIESLLNKDTNIHEYKNWEFILTNNDYVFAFHYLTNRFYYDKRIHGFGNKFDRLEYYITKFKKNK